MVTYVHQEVGHSGHSEEEFRLSWARQSQSGSYGSKWPQRLPVTPSWVYFALAQEQHRVGGSGPQPPKPDCQLLYLASQNLKAALSHFFSL